MSYYAQVVDGIVAQVIVTDNDWSEIETIAWLKEKVASGLNIRWVKTSYTNKIRKAYAGIGDSFDAVKDIFFKPQPFKSWFLDEKNDWQSPVEKPTDGLSSWDEPGQKWILDQ